MRSPRSYSMRQRVMFLPMAAMGDLPQSTSTEAMSPSTSTSRANGLRRCTEKIILFRLVMANIAYYKSTTTVKLTDHRRREQRHTYGADMMSPEEVHAERSTALDNYREAAVRYRDLVKSGTVDLTHPDSALAKAQHELWAAKAIFESMNA